MKIRNKTNIQVRQGCYETNSSSTHSVTIQTIGKKDNSAPLPLVEDGILYPSRLNQFSTEFGESCATVCDTKDKKAAWTANAIYNVIGDYLYNLSETEQESMISKWIQYLKDATGYEGIEHDFGYFCPYSEYGDNLFSYEPDEENIKAGIDTLIKAILDDTKEIIDSDTAN